MTRRREQAFANIGAPVLTDGATSTVEQVMQDASTAGERVVRVDPARLKPSPFQPPGRPASSDVAAVERAIEQAGSLAALLTPDGDEATRLSARLLAELTEPAEELAQLAADVATAGIREPLDARELTDGSLELIAGHRRRAAATLANLSSVPVRVRGRLTDAAAAVEVFRSNRLRENFGAWQQAVSLVRVREEWGRSEGKPPSVRALAERMGYSVGKASELVSFADDFPPSVLASIAGTTEAGSEALARLSYKTLRGLHRLSSAESRVKAARRAAQIELPDDEGAAPVPTNTNRERVRQMVGKRGATTLVVDVPIPELDRNEAATLLDLLTTATRAVRRRLADLKAATDANAEKTP